jgi:DHA1 family bicyclomycin/chloramphenicol resistance-like MFS transporter
MPSNTRPSNARLTVVLGTLSAFAPISIDMYLPGLPAIAEDFGVPIASAQLTLSLFFIGMALGQAFYGPLSDRYGRRAPLLVGSVVYVVASLGCAIAPSVGSLIFLRLMQALGGCAGMVISRSVVRDLFDARDSARMFSFLMLVMGVAPITAPLIGGQMLVFFGWRAIFWVLTAFGLICIGLVLFQLPESLPPERRVRAGIGGSLVIYGRLLADRQFLGYAMAGGLITAGMFAYISGSPFVIIDLYGVSPDHYGLIFGGNALGLILISQLNRRLLLSYSSEAIIMAALVTVSIAGIVLAAVAATGFGGLVGLLVPLFICITCVGVIGPNTSALALVPHGQIAGSASALLGTLQFATGTITAMLVGVLHNGTALPMAAMIAACAILALITYQLLARGGQIQAVAHEHSH